MLRHNSKGYSQGRSQCCLSVRWHTWKIHLLNIQIAYFSLVLVAVLSPHPKQFLTIKVVSRLKLALFWLCSQTLIDVETLIDVIVGTVNN